jgi:hypothetical protein
MLTETICGMMCLTLLLMLLLPNAALTTAPLPLLFVDYTTLKSVDKKLKLKVHPPVKGPLVISPNKPWESWAVFAYNHVLEIPQEFRGTDATSSSRFRLYYDCIEGNGLPPGSSISSNSISKRRICLAVSNNGLQWTKPELGIFNRNGTHGQGWSTNNNILLEDSGVSVFIDRSPAAVLHKTPFKMVTSQGAYESDDGIYWYKLPFKPTSPDDTKPTAYWDSKRQKYVISVRRDLQPDWYRTIGRCVTTNLSDWQSELGVNKTGCPVVFELDENDPTCHNRTNCTGGMDIYTNAWTPYPNDLNPVVHFFFPSMYYHFGPRFPFGFSNDGLLDIRLLVSRDGEHLYYVPDDRGGGSGGSGVGFRSPFVSLGMNECGATAPGILNGWCSPTSGIESKTTFDTSAMYMASGHLLSPDGNFIYLYSSGQPFTHGGDSSNQTWGRNTGLRVLTLRKDGFVSIDAPYYFRGGQNNTLYPTMVTVDVSVPFLECHPNSTLSVSLNFVTSVVGFVAVGIEQNGFELKGYELEQCNRMKGNSINGTASWGKNTGSVFSLVGERVAFRIALADASLYSVEFTCA